MPATQYPCRRHLVVSSLGLFCTKCCEHSYTSLFEDKVFISPKWPWRKFLGYRTGVSLKRQRVGRQHVGGPPWSLPPALVWRSPWCGLEAGPGFYMEKTEKVMGCHFGDWAAQRLWPPSWVLLSSPHCEGSQLLWWELPRRGVSQLREPAAPPQIKRSKRPQPWPTAEPQSPPLIWGRGISH